MKESTMDTRDASWRPYFFLITRKEAGPGTPSRRLTVLAPWPEAARVGAGLLPDETLIETRLLMTELAGLRRHPGSEEMADFFLTLGAALASGRSIKHALAMAARQALSPRLRGLAGALSCLVGQGKDLHEAMERFPRDFEPAHCALVRACSHTGLDQMGALLVRLSLRVRADGRLGRKLSSAMAYPAVLLVMALVSSILLETQALPPMVELFRSLGAPLPLVTRIFYRVARALGDHALLSGLAVVLLPVFCAAWMPRLLRAFAATGLALRLWIVGPVLQARALVRSLSLFALLKRSGVRNAEIFEMSAKAAGNAVIARFFESAYRRVARGESLEEAFLGERHRLGEAGIRLAGKMELGMQTGELAPLLEALSTEFEEMADFKAALLPRALEVPMLVLCALLVGSIMLAMFLPYPTLLGDIARQMRP